jgi:DNA-binding LacI/PurR family transcriptional regulator
MVRRRRNEPASVAEPDDDLSALTGGSAGPVGDDTATPAGGRRIAGDGRDPERRAAARLRQEPAGRPAIPTMRDIGRLAGVSQSTVSRVLNDAPTRVPIAPETRERVVLAARRLGYRPNPLARGLRGAPTMLIGAVVRDITDPFFAGAIEALSVEAMARGYNVVLGHAHSRADEAIALATVLETRHTDAIVLLGDMQDQPTLLADLRDSIVPVVAMWQGSSLLEVPTVDVDNGAGIRAGLEHLADLGHEQIAFVSGRLLGDIRERQAAYEEFMVERFRAVPTGYIQHVANTPADGETAAHSLLGRADRPTAIVTSTDTLAVGVLHAAYSLGLRVPDELSVVGFDDILLASHTVPALTTLRMPTAEIVRAGLDLAIELARDPRAPREPLIKVIEPSLIVRQSTAPPREAPPAA